MTDHTKELDAIFEKYGFMGVARIEGWATEDVTRAAELLDVELMEREWKREFRSPFDVLEECGG